MPKDTVLMSSRAPVGYLALSKIEVAINQGYIAILPNMKYSAEYLIQWCEANMAEIKGRASGTTFQEISKKNFREISFVCPDDKVVVSYTSVHDKFHRTLILSGFCFLKIAKISLNSSFSQNQLNAESPFEHSLNHSEINSLRVVHASLFLSLF